VRWYEKVMGLIFVMSETMLVIYAEVCVYKEQSFNSILFNNDRNGVLNGMGNCNRDKMTNA
jgi:hypothetical protein